MVTVFAFPVRHDESSANYPAILAHGCWCGVVPGGLRRPDGTCRRRICGYERLDEHLDRARRRTLCERRPQDRRRPRHQRQRDARRVGGDRHLVRVQRRWYRLAGPNRRGGSRRELSVRRHQDRDRTRQQQQRRARRLRGQRGRDQLRLQLRPERVDLAERGHQRHVQAGQHETRPRADHRALRDAR